MREFFRGWRRKAGLATLAMALLVAVAWGRSWSHQDLFWFQTNEASYFGYSTDAAIVVWWNSDRRFSSSCGWMWHVLAFNFTRIHSLGWLPAL